MPLSSSTPPLPPVPGVVPPRVRTVHLVTHPESRHHVERLVGGQHDSNLTDRGTDAARRVAAALRERIPAGHDVGLVASDLRRTRRTADVVATALGVAPTVDPRLREKSYGVAEGRPQDWLDARFVHPPATGERLHHHEGITGAETRYALGARVYDAMTDALVAHDVDHLVVVTHGFAATFVVAAWIGMPLDAASHVAFPVPSVSITTMREDEPFHNRAVLHVGDVAHLL